MRVPKVHIGARLASARVREGPSCRKNRLRTAFAAQTTFDTCQSFTTIADRVATFERGNGDVVESEYDMLIGADGVNSRVRKKLEENVPDFTVRQRKVVS